MKDGDNVKNGKIFFTIVTILSGLISILCLLLINNIEMQYKYLLGAATIIFGISWYLHVMYYGIIRDVPSIYKKLEVLVLFILIIIGIAQILLETYPLVYVIIDSVLIVMLTFIAVVLNYSSDNKIILSFIPMSILLIASYWLAIYNNILIAEYFILTVIFVDLFVESLFNLIELTKLEKIEEIEQCRAELEKIKKSLNLKENEENENGK